MEINDSLLNSLIEDHRKMMAQENELKEQLEMVRTQRMRQEGAIQLVQHMLQEQKNANGVPNQVDVEQAIGAEIQNA